MNCNSWKSRRVALFVFALAVLAANPATLRAQMSFGPPAKLTSGALSDDSNFQPQVATDGLGNWIAAWESWDGSMNTVFIARSTDGGGRWTVPVPLAAGYTPSIASDGVATWIVAWTDGTKIKSATSTDIGVSWTSPSIVADFSSNARSGATLGEMISDGAGHWVAVGSYTIFPAPIDESTPTINSVWAARSDDGGATWTVPVALNAAAGASPTDWEPRLAADRAGNLTAVWMSGVYSIETQILAAQSSDGGATWSLPVTLNSVGSPLNELPDIATDGLGNWIAVWDSSAAGNFTAGSYYNVIAARSTDNGASWSLQAQLNTNLPSDSDTVRINQRPRIATDLAGRWVTAWHSYDQFLAGTDGLDFDAWYAVSSDAGSTWSQSTPLAVNTEVTDAEPTVAADANGHWEALWYTTTAGAPGADISVAQGGSCGNGVVAAGEQCDDGNLVDGDGCSSTCQTELLSGAAFDLEGAGGARSANAARGGRVRLVSNDSQIALGRGNLSSDDPVRNGSTLRIVSDAGDGFDSTFDLPAEHWSYIGRAGHNRGYRYSDPKGTAGPIRTALVRSGKLIKISGVGAGMNPSLRANPNPVGVFLALGGRSYQLSFGGKVAFRPGRYRASKAPAPTQ